MMSLNNCGYLRVATGIVTAVVVSAVLLQPPVDGEEASGMDREETSISADSVTITILYDNIPYDDGYTTSGGFACLVEIPGAVILFDSGGHGSILLKNMARLGVTPGAVDAVVLSHEHWDHTGGLDGFLDSNPEVQVYIPSTFSGESRGVLSKRGIEPIDLLEPREIVPGVRSCGVMGEAIPEQSISISTDRGPIVITGCAHPGIAEITKRRRIWPEWLRCSSWEGGISGFRAERRPRRS